MQTSLFVKLLGCALFPLAMVSCVSSYPTAQSLEGYYHYAEAWGQDQQKLLDAELKAGKISKTEHQSQSAAIRREIDNRAHELAWAKFELKESEKRAMGIPTAELPMDVGIPRVGGGDSFHRRHGEYGLDNSSYSSPSAQFDRAPSEMREIRGY